MIESLNSRLFWLIWKLTYFSKLCQETDKLIVTSILSRGSCCVVSFGGISSLPCPRQETSQLSHSLVWFCLAIFQVEFWSLFTSAVRNPTHSFHETSKINTLKYISLLYLMWRIMCDAADASYFFENVLSLCQRKRKYGCSFYKHLKIFISFQNNAYK